MAAQWILLAAVMVVAATANPVLNTISIKMERYDNPADRLQDGTNCDPFGITKCDPYFLVTVRNSYNTSQVQSFTSSHTDDVSTIEFGSFMGFLNPISVKAPNGTVLDITVVAMDDDPIGSHELIGTWNYFYIGGQPAKRENRVSASATLTVLFDTKK